jgi:hypothetical protein
MPSTLLEEYILSALQIITTNLRLYCSGEYACYRVVAIQLQLLLCDTTRIHGRSVDTSLISGLNVEIKLPALKQAALGGRVSIDADGERLSSSAWLSQALTLPGGEALTLRQFIRVICEQDGGAHVDLRPEKGMRGWPERADHIAVLGECVLLELGGIFD